MVIRVVAIKPKSAPMADKEVERLLFRQLGPTAFAGDMIREMANYPPQQPTISGYRRTGDLGRGWRMTGRGRNSRGLFTEVTNRIRYGGRVQGRSRGPKGPGRQTQEMKRRQWTPVDRGARKVWGRHKPIIVRILTQRDGRVRAQRRRIR